jgi:hypothetical protein
MKFVEVMPGKFQSRLDDDTFIWIVQEGPAAWWWHLGGRDGRKESWSDSNGPFPDMWGAVADAVARYEGFEDKTIVWWVYRPTYGGGILERPALWRLEMVEAGSERDRMLASKRTTTDAGEVVEIPGDWRRFPDRESAETWMTEEAERWERWYAFWNS